MEETQVERLLSKHQRVIHILARRYCIRGHCILNEEDLYCEGLKLLVEMSKKIDPTSFDRMFKRSLRNRFIDLIRYNLAEERKCIEVDLDSVVYTIGSISLDELFIRKKIEHMCSILKLKHSRKVLMEIAFPSQPTVKEAMKDYIRGKHLFLRGKANGLNAFKIKSSHIAHTLNLTKTTVENCLREIKQTMIQMTLGSI